MQHQVQEKSNFSHTGILMTIRGVLIDLDGVLYMGGKAIPGAAETIEYLNAKNIPFRCISNTTRKCRRTICSQLSAMGFEIPEEYIFTPPLAAVAYMKKNRKTHIHLLVTGDSDQDFANVMDNNPGAVDYVVIGDAGDKITYDSLNRAFRHLMDGAELIALEKDRYWMERDGLSLSAGPFVSALEYATGKTALIMGKPSKAFFDLALRDMHLPPSAVAMIGDDILTDVGGAQQAGITGILVRTGKFREDLLQKTPVKPDKIIHSIADLKGIV